jgi:hypothetical protein
MAELDAREGFSVDAWRSVANSLKPSSSHADYTVIWRCSPSDTSVTNAAGQHCWCGKEAVSAGLTFRSKWVHFNDSGAAGLCSTGCAYDCSSNSSWRSASSW